MGETFKNRLERLSGSWDQARERAKTTPGFSSDIPDGRYRATLTGAEIGESQSSSRLQVAWEYCVTEGESAGKFVRDYDGLETEENMVWLFRKLATLGYDVDALELSELDQVLKDVIGRKVVLQLRLKTKGDYQNVYIDKLLDESGVETDEPKLADPASPTEPAVAEEEEEVVEDEAAQPTKIEAGMKVNWHHNEETRTGVVRAISPTGDAAQVLRGDGKLVKVALDKLIPVAEGLDE